MHKRKGNRNRIANRETPAQKEIQARELGKHMVSAFNSYSKASLQVIFVGRGAGNKEHV